MVALETGGRFSEEAYQFLEELAYAKAAEAPPALRKSARLAWQRRWVRLLACTAARACCSSVVAPAGSLGAAIVGGPIPDWHDVAARR